MGEIEKELSPLLTYLRDCREDLSAIKVDDASAHQEMKVFLKAVRPEWTPLLKLYNGPKPLFEAEGIEAQIQEAAGKKNFFEKRRLFDPG